MSARTLMVSSARPGCTRAIFMPRAWVARSRAHIASAVASARAWASAGECLASVMNRPSGKDGALDQRRNAVAVLAIAGAEVGQDGPDIGHADAIGPSQRTLGVIDTEAHRGIGAGRRADALVDRVGGLVGEH